MVTRLKSGLIGRGWDSWGIKYVSYDEEDGTGSSLRLIGWREGESEGGRRFGGVSCGNKEEKERGRKEGEERRRGRFV